MSDPIRAYQSAMREYETARESAAGIIKFIGKVASGLTNYVAAFLYLNYGAPFANRDSYAHRDYKVDMTKWPDKAAIDESLQRWVASYSKLHEAWQVIPEQERIGLTPPPSRIDPA